MRDNAFISMEQEIYNAISLAVATAVAPLQKELQKLKAQANQPKPEDTSDMDEIWERKARELGFIK